MLHKLHIHTYKCPIHKGFSKTGLFTKESGAKSLEFVERALHHMLISIQFLSRKRSERRSGQVLIREFRSFRPDAKPAVSLLGINLWHSKSKDKSGMTDKEKVSAL